MAAAPFYFQILLAGLKGVSPEVANRSIVIEVSPEEISQSALAGKREKPERDLAERIARRVAAEVIQGESVSGPEESNSIAQIGALPDDLREKPPTLQRGAVRAWLV
jgi:hypothetical protein